VSEAGAITIERLSHAFPAPGSPLPVLAGIDLTIGAGEFVAVLGPSGCGKSTLLRIVAGLLAPSAGRVLIDGLPPDAARQRKAIGFVFQDPSLLPWRSVEGNVRLPWEVNRQGVPVATVAQRTAAMLELVGLRQFARYLPHQLSGGMQQRVAIARALAFGPAVLLMDEPFGALDAITRDTLRDELQRIWLVRRPTIVFVTHSIAEAVYLADRVVVLSGRPGRIRASEPVPLPRPRDVGAELSSEFIALTARLKSLLR
jgi:NitT/TauT family transport system ATP-binding protein